jgi:uncharacterized RDD family membrane protein YckC
MLGAVRPKVNLRLKPWRRSQMFAAGGTIPVWLGENRDESPTAIQVSKRMNAENPYAPPRANVSDVAASSEELELAGRGIRLGAHLLDSLIASVFTVLPLLFGGLNFLEPEKTSDFSPLAGFIALAGLVAWAWITIVYVARNGQTIAKKWLDIKVVRSDGSKASLGRIFWLRNVVNGLLGIIPFYAFIDPLVIFGESRQCIHDKIADTIVVVA